MKKLWAGPLKILGLVTIIAGFGVAIVTLGYLLILGLCFIVTGFILYLINYLISKLNSKTYRYSQWSLSILYLFFVICSYLKWQEHTSFVFPNHQKNAGIIFGIQGYPELPSTIFWAKKVSIPKNGIMITSTKAEDMPVWQRYQYTDGTTPKTDSEITWEPNITYNCIINDNVIKAWLFTVKKDTGLSVQRSITALSNLVNEGKITTLYKTSDQLIVNGQGGPYLSLQGEGLSFLPDAIAQLKIETVYLADNQFRTIPPQLYNIPTLHDIYISHNPIQKLPEDLYKIRSLKSLLIGSTLIREIKADLSKMDSLTYLDISSNKLNVFPEQIKKIPHLSSLCIQENAFTNLSFVDNKLGKLETLEVYSNKLKSMSGIGALVNLKELIIFDNQLDSIPADICKLTRLEKLEIWNNPIKFISPQIKQLSNLKKLTIDDNNLNAEDKAHLKLWLPSCTINFQTR